MATEGKRRAGLGSKREVAPGKWVVRVQAGYRADGKARRVSRTVYGTELEADAAILELARGLGAQVAERAGVTLDQYYWGVFRGTPSNRGKPRAKASLREYDGQMERYVSPFIGNAEIAGITHEQLRMCIERSGAPTKTKTVLRAVMRRAYDDGWIAEMPFQRRVITVRQRKPPVEPWTAVEAAAALRKLSRSTERPDLVMNAYLILGLSGLRKEEALAVRPCDIKSTTTYDLATGSAVESTFIEVSRAYTDDDGIKETKTEGSVRTVPVLMAGRERLAEILGLLRPGAETVTEGGGSSVMDAAELAKEVEAWTGQRIVNMRGDNLVRAWRRMCERHNLRYIPPKALRHTSETLMVASGVSALSVMDLHGHTDLGTDYRHYIKPGLAERERAAQRVGETLGAAAAGGFNAQDGPDGGEIPQSAVS